MVQLDTACLMKTEICSRWQNQKKLTKMQEVFVNLMVYQDLNQSECAFRAGLKIQKLLRSYDEQ